MKRTCQVSTRQTGLTQATMCRNLGSMMFALLVAFIALPAHPLFQAHAMPRLGGVTQTSLLLASIIGLMVVGIIPPVARADNFYVSDYVGRNVQRVNSIGAVSTFVNTTNGPSGLAFDASGNLYVNTNGAITRYNSAGVGTPFAASSSTSASGITFDSAGNLYVATFSGNSVEKITPAGVRTVFATGGLNESYALAFDKAGNLFVSNDGDYSGGANGTILELAPSGTGTVFATGLSDAQGLAFDNSGNLYVAETLAGTYTGIIEEFTTNGVRSVFATLGADVDPVGLAFDSKGSLYAAVTNQNNGTNMIDKFAPNGTATIFATVGSGPIDLAVTTDAGVPLALPIPEPSTVAMVGAAAGLLCVRGGLRKKAVAAA